MAMRLSIEASTAAVDPSQRLFFIYDTRPTYDAQQGQLSPPAGAAVIYKQATANNDSWRVTDLKLSYSGTGRADEAGLLSISTCLSVATMGLRTRNQRGTPKITIFTHFQDALRTIDAARLQRSLGNTSTSHHTDCPTEQVQATPALLEVFKRSRFLCRKFGATITLQWMPHTATVERHRLAEAAAAATNRRLPTSRALPSSQRPRRDQDLRPSQRSYHRRELGRMRGSNWDRPSPVAQQVTSASTTAQQAQAESRDRIVEDLGNLRVSDDQSMVGYD